MKLARAAVDGSVVWGRVESEEFVIASGDPWSDMGDDLCRIPLEQANLLSSVEPSKIICLGRNYAEHIQEMGYLTEEKPSLFMKPPTTIVGPAGTVVLPPETLSAHVEHEAELAVVIGRRATAVSTEDALDYVLGFTCADDVSARDLQRGDPHPTRGKGFDTFCPIGPWIETDLDLEEGARIMARVNGELRQDGNTLQMIHRVPFLVSFISHFTTLLPGDVLLTGSPGGTGSLLPGDEVEIEIEGVGILRHGVAASTHHHQNH